METQLLSGLAPVRDNNKLGGWSLHSVLQSFRNNRKTFGSLWSWCQLAPLTSFPKRDFNLSNAVKMLLGDAGSDFMPLFKITYIFFIMMIIMESYFRWRYQPCRSFETIEVGTAQM